MSQKCCKYRVLEHLVGTIIIRDTRTSFSSNSSDFVNVPRAFREKMLLGWEAERGKKSAIEETVAPLASRGLTWYRVHGGINARKVSSAHRRKLISFHWQAGTGSGTFQVSARKKPLLKRRYPLTRSSVQLNILRPYLVKCLSKYWQTCTREKLRRLWPDFLRIYNLPRFRSCRYAERTAVGDFLKVFANLFHWLR